MTPRQKAALRAQEILNELNGSLPYDERRELEQELGAIADNIAEGCYSNDPDDGVDWSDCPGIHGKVSHIQDETAFVNQAYVRACGTAFEGVKFYAGDGSDCLRMVYYNPNSDAGGQLVQNNLSLEVLKEAFENCVTEEQFWDCLHEQAHQILIDIDNSDFADEARFFVEEPCNFYGQDHLAMKSIQTWVAHRHSDTEQSQGMKMQ